MNKIMVFLALELILFISLLVVFSSSEVNLGGSFILPGKMPFENCVQKCSKCDLPCYQECCFDDNKCLEQVKNACSAK